MEPANNGRSEWWSPVGVMVFMLAITLGVTTYLAVQGQQERQLLIEQERVGQIRDDALHQKTADLLECIVTSPGDLRNPNLDPELRTTTEQFLDECFKRASVEATKSAPPIG